MSSDSPSGEQSVDDESESDEGSSAKDDNASKGSQTIPSFPSGGYGQEQQYRQLGASNIPHKGDESISPRQLELVGHSIACASDPYGDPYYGAMLAAYGQPVVHPYFLDVHQARVPLPNEMAQEPVYVNAKQYHAILRRRQSRAKAELEKKLIKDRKPYLHESRHQHAMRRLRGSGGRFAKKSDVNSSKRMDKEKNPSSKLELSLSKSSQSSIVHQDSIKSGLHGSSKGRKLFSDEGCFEYQNSMKAPTYPLHSAERGQGGSIGQQWRSMPSNQTSQSAVALK